MSDSNPSDTETITVSGVTFTADQVKSATVTIDGRDVRIGEKPAEKQLMGFTQEQKS